MKHFVIVLTIANNLKKIVKTQIQKMTSIIHFSIVLHRAQYNLVNTLKNRNLTSKNT